MIDKEILRKAIIKAEKNGWVQLVYPNLNSKSQVDQICIRGMILSHDFAKAFFGEKDMWYETPCTCGGALHIGMDQHYNYCDRVKAERGYKFHLGKMVLEENPLLYLEKFL